MHEHRVFGHSWSYRHELGWTFFDLRVQLMHLGWLLVGRWWKLKRLFHLFLPRLGSFLAQLVYYPKSWFFFLERKGGDCIRLSCFFISGCHNKISWSCESVFPLYFLHNIDVDLKGTSTDIGDIAWEGAIDLSWDRVVKLNGIYCSCHADERYFFKPVLCLLYWCTISISYVGSYIVHQL